LFKKQMLIK